MKDKYTLSNIDRLGQRLEIIPAEVKGYFRQRRTFFHFFLLLIFLAGPWLYWQGHQLVQLDFIQGRFILFGNVFRAHDSPLLFPLLSTLLLFIAFLTLLFGRVWCGWACPQTVFIDALYRKIEIWVEGPYLQRRVLAQAPMSWKKLRKRFLKWTLFAVVSGLISHSFLAYFWGSRELLAMMQGSPTEHWNYFLLTVAMTGVLLFNFAWFREQFCVLVCPYGRFQSVLSDSNTITVLYDVNRGEPRKSKSTARDQWKSCVDCRRCVEVCPTGIDIRNGTQMECISCTACIDACDEIMEKTKQPKGLIRYASQFKETRFFRVRAIVIGILLLISSLRLIAGLQSRMSFESTIVRAQEIPFQLIEDQGQRRVSNHFKLNFKNTSDHDLRVAVKLVPEQQDWKLIFPQNDYPVEAQGQREIHFFVAVPLEIFKDSNKLDFSIQVSDEKGLEIQKKDLFLLGPDH